MYVWINGSSRFSLGLGNILQVDSQGWNAPVCSWFLPSLDEERQPDQIDGWSDSQRPDELQHKANQPWESEHDLKQRGHQDCSLDLQKEHTLSTSASPNSSDGRFSNPVYSSLYNKQSRTDTSDRLWFYQGYLRQKFNLVVSLWEI